MAWISSMEYVPPPMVDTRNAPARVEADPDTAVTRFRLVANLYRAGFETRRDALRVSAHRGAHHPPSPCLA